MLLFWCIFPKKQDRNENREKNKSTTNIGQDDANSVANHSAQFKHFTHYPRSQPMKRRSSTTTREHQQQPAKQMTHSYR